MELFEVRLEAQDGSGHFRITHLEAEDKAAAKRHCERLEFQKAGFELSQEQIDDLLARYEVASLDDLPKAAPLSASAEEKAPFRALATQDRARLHAHFQEQPYKVVSVKKRPARGGVS